ncbi:hypothetical protein, partial [Enterocloster sp.]|uniref:hypothetical protein n=1 Tax=Enterocloster sp. TaxID=2719315 RepID=UPI003076DD65
SGFYILFNLQFSRIFAVVSSAATFISYHSRSRLSTTFLFLFFRFCRLPQRVSMISHLSAHVNHFFNNFQKLFLGKWSGERGI